MTGKIPDGFHVLQTLFAFLDYGDVLDISVALPGESSTFHLTGPFAASLEKDLAQETSSPLILKAIDWFHAYFSIENNPLRISLEKNIPIAAGMGGGSADAAAVLTLLLRLKTIELSPEKKMRFISDSGVLGADVPVCLANQLGVGRLFLLEGSGKTECPLSISHSFLDNATIVLCNPLQPISTSAAFKGLTNFSERIEIPSSFADDVAWWSFLTLQKNDFEIPSGEQVPDIQKILHIFRQNPACILAQLSGTGATCWAIFIHKDEAVTALETIQIQRPDWWFAITSLQSSS